jgi:magnesium chelatase subunit I
VEVKTPQDIAARVEVVKRRDSYERDRAAFVASWQKAEADVRRQIADGRMRLAVIQVPDGVLELVAKLCMALGTDGLRGELTVLRAARAAASLAGAKTVEARHVAEVAASCLRHRLRRNPLDDTGSTVRVERAVKEVLGP